jgi:2-succinyl-5-enolpyruvyl-6-hydroxy-3-cyclohexene-1-carboxylate synthase
VISDKKSVQYLHKFCSDLGIVNWVVSPGSRNAPITFTIANDPKMNPVPVVDERSAAFVALGQALNSGMPSAITCTSGSAALNYAPAIAEAYYQGVPMLIVTADRPQKWIDNGEGQSIDQVDVYQNYCLASFHLNEDDQEAQMENVFDELAKVLFGHRKGPVHLNLAFDEPLYDKMNHSGVTKQFELPIATPTNWNDDELVQAYTEKSRVMILVGQMEKNENLAYLLSELLADKRVVVLKETNANVSHFNFVSCIDRTLPPLAHADFHPELVITLGGAIVSKRIKRYLRSIEGLEHWHISAGGTFPNTFEKLTAAIAASAEDVLRKLLAQPIETGVHDFQNKWVQRSFVNQEKHNQFVANVGWSDLKVHQLIHEWLPENAVLHQGNSSVVRYFQLFDPIKSVTYHSNRGVSGIDGCVSTAIGASLNSSRLNVLVVGDLSFVYDINGLWNQLDKSNLLIVVINNGGGGIFKIIEGPASTGEAIMSKYFEVGNASNTKMLIEAHGVHHHEISDEQMFEQHWFTLSQKFESGEYETTVLEVNTENIDSASILKEYFKTVNQQ